VNENFFKIFRGKIPFFNIYRHFQSTFCPLKPHF